MPHVGAGLLVQDEFELAKELVVSGQQVVETLSPLMTDERIQRIDKVRSVRPGLSHPSLTASVCWSTAGCASEGFRLPLRGRFLARPPCSPAQLSKSKTPLSAGHRRPYL
jgi:hypothetical protein